MSQSNLPGNPGQASPELPDYLKDQRRLDADSTFTFGCHPGVPCFNTCCRDVNIVLTPLDVLQLARATGLETGEFLEKHTLNPITKELHLPVIMLKMGDDEERLCPFLGDEGCTVYDRRPWACRMYPVGMAIPPARAGVEPEPIYFLFEDDHCQGRCQQTQWTAQSWREDQNIIERDELEAGFRELVTHPWFIGGRQLDPKRLHMFYMACYDLDTFRSFIFGSTFCERFQIEEELREQLANNDEALLRFAFRWLRFALFGEPTVKVCDGAAAAAGSAR
jgi:Fe-S-cluster containining protein